MSERKIVFMSHCILNQSVMGKERQSSSLKEIVKFFAESDVCMVQLPCPEAEFGKSNARCGQEYRECCRRISKNIICQVRGYLKRNYKVLGILGMEFSRACGVYKVESGRKIISGKGVLTDELEKGMQSENFQVPIISVNAGNVFSTLQKLSLMMKNC